MGLFCLSNPTDYSALLSPASLIYQMNFMSPPCILPFDSEVYSGAFSPCIETLLPSDGHQKGRGRITFSPLHKGRWGHTGGGWALSHYDWCPCEWRTHADTHGGETPREEADRDWIYAAIAKEDQGLPATARPRESDVDPTLPQNFQWHLDLGLLASRAARE